MARSPVLLGWLFVLGLSLAVSGATVTAVRLHAYLDDAAQLSSSGTRIVQLPGGDDVIFVGERDQSDAQPFGPAQVSVIDERTGASVPTRWDPSTDELSPRGEASRGLVSFVAPTAGPYRISIDGPRGLAVVVVRNEGSEARLVASWVATLVVGLAVVVAALVGAISRWRWRARARRVAATPTKSVEEWMARTPY